MSVRRILAIAAVVSLPFFLLAAQLKQPPQVHVEGIVYGIDQGKYVPFQGASIQAHRGGPLLKNPVVTGTDGKFSFTVAEGPPFNVSFAGDDVVPELTQLAGFGKAKNVVHVALLTAAQYRGTPQGERFSLKSKLEFTLAQLPDDSDASKTARAMLEKGK